MGSEISTGGCSACAHSNAIIVVPNNLNDADPTKDCYVDGTEVTPGVSELVVVELVDRVHSGKSTTASTVCALSSKNSNNSTVSRGRMMSLFKTPGIAGSVTPDKLDLAKLGTFKERLNKAGIDTISWGYNGAKTVEHLYWEANEQKGCAIIASPDGGLKRITRMVKIRLVAEIFGIDHTLLSRIQFLHNGQAIERKQVPLQKLRWQSDSGRDIQEWSEELYAEACSCTEPWDIAVVKTLEQRLGMSQAWQKQHLVEVPSEYSFSTEDDIQSDGYPGLNTLYCIHECTFRVRDPLHLGVAFTGLPDGQEFATAEGDFSLNMREEIEGLAIGSQLNIWMWAREITSFPAPKVDVRPIATASTQKVVDDRKQYRVHLPLSVQEAASIMERNMNTMELKAPTGALWAAMQNSKTDWPRVRKIASRILDPTYSADMFADDLQAFPELSLYLLEKGKADQPMAMCRSTSSSGRTASDEYQRTMGAFFAIYWLIRAEIDGKDGFCNGVDVDNNGKPIVLAGKNDNRVSMPEKRLSFKEKAMWPFFRRLLVKAGVFEDRSIFPFRSGSKLQVNEKRLVSLLALTAIHDIMKMNFLLPEVQPQHAPYHGYKVGDKIGDHDHALSYIMEHYPQTLPSFWELDSDAKRALKFTQCNLSFNHGWFVQGEASPGAIFTKFREALISEHKSKIGQRDVALYFVHWLTDLAGAEPTPFAGCEKFVTKFPLAVLNSFLRSFEFVERIVDHTETEVTEEYLLMRWAENTPPLGPTPLGDSAIAKMRLACMAQMNAAKVLQGFDGLVEEDREVLSQEMARSGCIGQQFSPAYTPKDVNQIAEGPVFLVYYGPAFLQSLGDDCAKKRLSILAEVYRCARELWPLDTSQVVTNVTIRIDMIKSLSIAEMLDTYEKGDVWIMIKHNENEAFLEKATSKKVNKLVCSCQKLQIIDFSCLLAYNAGAGFSQQADGSS